MFRAIVASVKHGLGEDAMRRAIYFLLCSGFAFLAVNATAQAEKRVALVIGNGAYANATQLPNPPHDAEDVAAALKRDGFGDHSRR
jgi:hypothetical protein